MANLTLASSQTYRNAVLESSPTFCAPLDSKDGLTDLTGNYTATGAGSITAGGYATGPLGNYPDLGATDFDGTDDRITTDYGTRRNLCTNPGFEIDKSGWRDVGQSGYCQNSSGVWTREASGGRRDGPCSKFVKPDDPDQFSGFEMIPTATVIGQDYTVSMWLKGESGGEGLHIGIGSVPTAGGSGYKTVVLTTEWERYEFTFEVLTAVSTVFMRNSNYGANGMTWYMDDVLFEQASSAGTYFDGSGYVNDTGNWISDPGGHVGWLGTAHASASDKGCFANGTVRTFEGWAYRDASADADTILSGSGSAPPVLALSSGSQNIVWKPQNSTTTTWTAAGPGNGAWFHWALVFTEVTDAVSLYINGALVSTTTNAQQFSASCGNLQLGTLTSTTDPFDGKQAWVSVHERALTASEIVSLYDAGVRLSRSYDFLDTDNSAYVQADGIDLPVVTRDDTFAETSDSEGRSRIRSRATNPEGAFRLYFKGTTDATFWALIDSIQELVEDAHENKGTITYEPDGGVAVTWDLQSISVTGLPQNGVTLRQHHAATTVSYEVKPYGKLPRIPLVASTALTGPIDDFVLESVPGQVSALGDLTITDTATQSRYFGEIGVQHDCDPDDLEPIQLDAVVDLTALSGSSNTRSGSIATNILRSALTTSAVAVCSTGDQPHKGKWKIRCRVYPSATDVRVRLAWRVGDGPFSYERWKEVPNSAGWYDLDLGTVNIAELAGTHTWEGRIEARCISGVPTVDVDTVQLLPADTYVKVQGADAADTGTSAYIAVEDFSTLTVGALAGKTPLLAPSGNWSGAGDAVDLTVSSANQKAFRTEVSDTDLNTGRYARCGTGTLINTTATVDIEVTFDDGPLFRQSLRAGVFLRYTDVNNWLAAVAQYPNGFSGTLKVIKRVAGTVTELGSASVFRYGPRTIVGAATPDGEWGLLEGPVGGALEWRLVSFSADADLATAGALASGGYGIYDANSSANAATRYYDNFSIVSSSTAATLTNPALYSGQTLNLLHNTVLTEASDGSVMGRTPVVTGKLLKLPPSTLAGRSHRIVSRFRREDVDGGFADNGVSDGYSADLSVTPRVHLTGK